MLLTVGRGFPSGFDSSVSKQNIRFCGFVNRLRMNITNQIFFLFFCFFPVHKLKVTKQSYFGDEGCYLSS